MDGGWAWTVKDTGLGYKDYYSKYCDMDISDFYPKCERITRWINAWKGEQKMGTTLNSNFVSGELYLKNDDGTFTKVMTVTHIETNTTSCDDTIEVKVDGYASKKIEKEESVNKCKRIIKSVNEKWSPEDHIYFMTFTTFNGTILSVKISRNDYNYSYPYFVTAYDNGKVVWTEKYKTWRDLECRFLYEVAMAFYISFVPTANDKISRMLRNARRIVRYDRDMDSTYYKEDTAKMEAALSWLFKNGSYIRKELPVSAISNSIDKVIFDDPATVILWNDGTRTVVHTQDGEPYDKEKGFAMAVCKKIFGNERDYYHVFKRWFRKGEDRSKNEVSG